MLKNLKISKHYLVLILVLSLLAISFFFYRNTKQFLNISLIIGLVYVVVLYIAVTRHRLNYFFTSINSGFSTGISLTFDDGPNPKYTEKVLEILERKNVKASFFIIGKNIKGNEELLKKIDQKGHIVANHSFGHSYWFNMLNSKKIANEIAQTETLIENLIGKKPRLFRTPFGLTSPNVAKGIKKAKVLSIGWDFRSFDTMAKDRNKLLKKLKLNAQKCSIMLLHDNNDITISVLEEFIDYCFTNGIEIVSLEKMIGEKAYYK